MRRALPPLLAGLASALFAGCVAQQPIEGTSFRVDLVVRGGGKRVLSVDVSPETRGLGIVKLTDATSIDDDASSVRRVRIRTPWTEGPEANRPRPGPNPSPAFKDHVEIAAYAARPVELVFEYHGHSDVYHLTFPPSGGALIEPESGEFTHVYMKVP